MIMESKLCEAIQMLQYERVKQLLQCKADPNKQCSNTHRAAIHWAAGLGSSSNMNIETVKLLLKYGGNPNLLSQQGNTPVHIAAMAGNVPLLRLLVESGGDPWICDGNGKTCWDLATENKQWNILSYLATYMDNESTTEFASNEKELEVAFEANPEFSAIDNAFVYQSSESSQSVSQSCLSSNFSMVEAGNIFSSTCDEVLNNAAFLNSNSFDTTRVAEEVLHVYRNLGLKVTQKRYPPLTPLADAVHDSFLNDAICSEDSHSKSSDVYCPASFNDTGFSKELLQLLNTVLARDTCSVDQLPCTLDRMFNTHFAIPSAEKPWREGLPRRSFNYILLDPRRLRDYRCSHLNTQQSFVSFLSAVFYIGKGNLSSPYEYLDEAATFKSQPNAWLKATSKTGKILDIWNSGSGVFSLHVFQDSLPVESLSREAAMIDALGLSSLTNIARGSYYGICTSWSPAEKKLWGAHLLQKAFHAFLLEGERQLFLTDF